MSEYDEDDSAFDLKREGLFVTDAELMRRLGVPERVARDALRALDVGADVVVASRRN
jgi:hypothetical protein